MEKQLTLNEMLDLAEKVERWEGWGNKIRGLVNDKEVTLTKDFVFSDNKEIYVFDYSIKLEIGRYAGQDKRFFELYEKIRSTTPDEYLANLNLQRENENGNEK